MKQGNRMSILPVSQYCGLAPVLSEQHGAGRAAAVSTVAHARAAGDPAWEDMAAALSDAEREDLDRRVDPTVLEWNGIELSVRDAEQELEVTLAIGGPVSVGHLDMAWHLKKLDLVVIVDIKASRWTVPEGVESLQLHAYGQAYADKCGARGYVTGLFFSEDGSYMFAEDSIDMLSHRAVHIRKRLAGAIANRGEANTGDHCRGCYSRLHCPEHTLKGISSGPLAQLSSGELTKDGAQEALQWLVAAKDVVKQVEGALKQYAAESGGIPTRPGKVWKSVTCAGRKGVSAKKLKAKYPEVYEEVYEQGAPYQMFKEVNE